MSVGIQVDDMGNGQGCPNAPLGFIDDAGNVLTRVEAVDSDLRGNQEFSTSRCMVARWTVLPAPDPSRAVSTTRLMASLTSNIPISAVPASSRMPFPVIRAMVTPNKANT